MKKILSILIFVLAIGLVSATNNDGSQNTIDDLGRFPTGSCVDLIQLCSNCTYNNVSLLFIPPNSTSIFLNAPMTYRGGSVYNYSYCSNSQTGQYIVNGVGDIDGIPTPWSYTYHIGGSLTVFLIICFCAIMLLGIAFLTGNEYLGFLAGAVFIVGGVYAMIYGISDFADDYTRMLAVVLIGIGLMFEIAVGYQVFSSGDGDD